MAETNGKHTATSETESGTWLTARAVAVRLGCSRQQVYKLEKRGKLRGKNVREGSITLRRFDPSDVRELSSADELEQLLDVELAGPDDEDEDDGAPPNAMRLAAKVVGESRQVAVDARRGQHDAYELIATPAREYTKLLMQALEAREKRIAELEEKLNKFYDEQREARLEEREATFFHGRMEREDARKEQFFKAFTDNLPALLDQLKNSLSGGGAAANPFVAWMAKQPPEKQIKMILAIEAVLGGGDEPEKGSSESSGASLAEKGAAVE